MKFRPLGRTNLAVSEICLGTMTFGQQTGADDAFAQMDHAVAQGINFFDTAELYAIPPRAETYGATETIIGAWLKKRGRRDDLIIASKVAGRSTMNWLRPGGAMARLDAKNIFHAVEGSLKRLGTDYIDLYQLHWPDRQMDLFDGLSNSYRDQGGPDGVSFDETLSALGELVKQGKIRHFGVSNETAWGVGQFLRSAEAGAGPRVVSIQNAYHLINRQFELGLAEFAMREQVGLLAYSPLAQGYLTGKYLQWRQAGRRAQHFVRARPALYKTWRGRGDRGLSRAGARTFAASGASGPRFRHLAALRDLQHHRRDQYRAVKAHSRCAPSAFPRNSATHRRDPPEFTAIRRLKTGGWMNAPVVSGLSNNLCQKKVSRHAIAPSQMRPTRSGPKIPLRGHEVGN